VKLLKDLLILIRCFLAPRQPPQRGGFFNGRIHLRRVRLSDILTTFIYTKEKKARDISVECILLKTFIQKSLKLRTASVRKCKMYVGIYREIRLGLSFFATIAFTLQYIKVKNKIVYKSYKDNSNCYLPEQE
jgi:hypothetical protein